MPGPTTPSGPLTVRDYIKQEASKLQIPPDLAIAITSVESGGQSGALSPKGARGFFQLMPDTAAELGVDPSDPFQNINGGLRYFKQQLDAHKGDVRLALAAYNAGPARTQNGTVPEIPETQDYVLKVLKAWQAGDGGAPQQQPTGLPTAAPAAATAGMISPDIRGLVEKGNVDLSAQPEVKNPDGSTSTVDSIGMNFDGKEYLLPTVTPDGRHFVNEARQRGVPEGQIGKAVGDMAAEEFKKTGRHLGVFDSPESSTAYAQQLHNDYAAGKYKAKPVGPTLGSQASQVVQSTLPAAGALVGGYQGALMGAPAGPFGAALGAVAGAGVGAFGGQGISSGLRYLGEKFGLIPTTQPITVTDIAGQMGSAANTAMMTEMLTKGGIAVMTPVAAKVLAPMKSKLTTYAAQALAAFPPKMRALLPAEISTSRGLNVAENIAEGSVYGGGPVAAVKGTRQGIAEAEVTKMLDALGPKTTGKVAGAGILDARQAAVEGFRDAENAAWTAFREEVGDVPIQTPKLSAFMQEAGQQRAAAILPNAGQMAAGRISALGGEAATIESIAPEYRLAFKQLPESIQAETLQSMSEANQVSATQFAKTVSDLGKLVRGLTRSAAMDPSKFNDQLGLSKKLLSLAKEDLVDTLTAASPRAAQAYDAARRVSRLGNKQLFNDAVMQVTRTAPEKIVTSLLQPNNSTAIGLVEKAVGPQAMEPVRRVALQRIVKINPNTGSVDWLKTAQRMDGLGDDTINALFPGGQAADVRKLTRLMLNIQHRPLSGAGRVGIAISQYGALAGVFSGTMTGPSAAVVLTPPILAKIMASPTGLKWLTTGLDAPLGSAQAVRAAMHVTAFLNQQTQDSDNLLNKAP